MKRFDFKKSLQKILIAIIITGIVLVVLEGFGGLDPIKKPIQQFTIPIQIGLFQVRNNIGNFLQSITEIGDLRDKNLQLEEDNAFLKAENQKLQA